MLIDSGASWTSISPGIAEDLGLPETGLRSITSVTQTVDVKEFLADMILPMGGSAPITDLRLVEFPMGDDSIAGLFGRDLLNQCLFQMNGPGKTFTLSY
jgi:hypothetical protein